jgi:DNA invertase Pin-like site-specific DNA recombinase
MESLIGVFAEFERDLIRKRVRVSLENARRKWMRPGHRPYFDMAKLGTLGRLRGRGLSVWAIARALNVSKSLVHNSLKILNSKVYENQGSEEEKSAVHE